MQLPEILKRRDFLGVAALLFLSLVIGGGGPHSPFNVAVIEAVAVLVLLHAALFGRLAAVGPGGRSGLLLILFMLVVGLSQLVPLPISWWQALPGRDILAQAMTLSDNGQKPWGISLIPDYTRSSLLAFLPPVATFAAVLMLRWRDRTRLVLMVVGVAAVSSVLGFAQVAAGDDGTLNPYGLPPFGLSVGFFANRNQQAIFMAAAFILTFGLWLEATRKGRRASIIWTALIMLLVAGCAIGTASRSGFAALLLGMLAGFSIWQRREIGRHGGLRAWFSTIRHRALFIAIGLAVVVALGVLFTSSYQFARILSRLENTGEDARIAFWPDVLYVLKLYFPFGAGFGTFDRVFQLSEPLQSLHFWRVNHAHNDYVELIIECGAAAIVILLGFAAWFVRRLMAVWRVNVEDAGGALMRCSAAAILFMLLHSLVEYPLRTEALACLFAMCCAFLTQPLEILPRGGGGADFKETPPSRRAGKRLL